MNETINEKIKEAVYVVAFGGTFYYAAKAFKADANAALIIGTAIGKILATPSKTNNDVRFF